VSTVSDAPAAQGCPEPDMAQPFISVPPCRSRQDATSATTVSAVADPGDGQSTTSIVRPPSQPSWTRGATSATTVSAVADPGDVQSTTSLGRAHRSRRAAATAVLGSASAAQGSDVDSDSSSVVAVVAKKRSKYNICIEGNTNNVSYWSFVEILLNREEYFPWPMKEWQKIDAIFGEQKFVHYLDVLF